MAERVSIHGPDAVAAAIVIAGRSFVGDGLRRVIDLGDAKDAVLKEVIRVFECDWSLRCELTAKHPLSQNWQIERDAYAVILAFLRTQLPVEPVPTEPEADHG